MPETKSTGAIVNINDNYASFDYSATNLETRGGGIKDMCNCLKCEKCEKKINSVIKLLKVAMPKYYKRFIQNKVVDKETLAKSSVKSTKSSVKSTKSSVKSTKSSVKPAKSSRKSQKKGGGLFDFNNTSTCADTKTVDYSLSFDANVFNIDNLNNNREFVVNNNEYINNNLTSSF